MSRKRKMNYLKKKRTIIYNKYNNIIQYKRTLKHKNVFVLQKSEEDEYTEKEYNHKYIYPFLVSNILIVFIYFFMNNIYINSQSSFSSINYIYKKYKVGDEVDFLNEKWHVVEDTNAEEDEIYLLGTNLLDINGDGLINNNDKCNYDDLKKIINVYRVDKNYKYVKELKILNSREYVLLREKMNYNYFWDEANFLAGGYDGNWWIDSEKDYVNYSVNTNGTYKEEEKESINYVRPVVLTLKKYLN